MVYLFQTKEFRNNKDWIKLWSAKGSLNFVSHMGMFWTQNKDFSGESAYKKIIFIHKAGVTDCWITQSDKDDLGKRLTSGVNYYSISKFSTSLIEAGREVMNFILKHDPTKMKLSEFEELWKLVHNYYIYHISVKYIVDYLSSKELKKWLFTLSEARLKTEQVYRNLENYLEAIAQNIAQNKKYTKEMVLSLTKEEFKKYFLDFKLPKKDELKERYASSSLIFYDGDDQLFMGEIVKKVEKVVYTNLQTHIIKGEGMGNGKTRGYVKIILDPAKVDSFNRNDVLVTGMTRPEYLPLIKKAKAIITDSGGILSHAAITARELRKPCITGTKSATRILHDGDLVEVDSEKGIVTIINRTK